MGQANQLRLAVSYRHWLKPKRKIMNAYTDNTIENKTHSVVAARSLKQTSVESSFEFVDNRQDAIAQRKLQEAINNSTHVQQLQAYQEMANNIPQAIRLRAFQEMANNSSQAKQAVQGRFNAIQLTQEEEEEAFRDLENLHRIDQENSRWTPSGSIPAVGDNISSTEDFTESFETILRNGSPLSLSELMNIIPRNAPNTWRPEPRIQVGFRYEFADNENVNWVVRAHAPEIANANPEQIGTLFWTVRIQRGEDHLLSEEVPINQAGTETSLWVKNIRPQNRTRLAHIAATPN